MTFFGVRIWPSSQMHRKYSANFGFVLDVYYLSFLAAKILHCELSSRWKTEKEVDNILSVSLSRIFASAKMSFVSIHLVFIRRKSGENTFLYTYRIEPQMSYIYIYIYISFFKTRMY